MEEKYNLKEMALKEREKERENFSLLIATIEKLKGEFKNNQKITELLEIIHRGMIGFRSDMEDKDLLIDMLIEQYEMIGKLDEIVKTRKPKPSVGDIKK